MRRLERLRDRGEGGAVARLDGRARRDADDLGVRRDALHGVEKVEPGDVGQRESDDRDVRRGGGQAREARAPKGRRIDLMALDAKNARERVAGTYVIVDDEER